MTIRRSAKRYLTSLERGGLAAKAFESTGGLLGSKDLQRPSCLIVDMPMSGMSGVELRHCLVTATPSSDDAHYRLPHGRDLARPSEAGVACDLTKPFTETELFACIESVVRGMERNEMNVDTRDQSHRFKP